MKNNYQKKAASAATVPELVMPDAVTLAMVDIADEDVPRSVELG